jgi:mRNA-degrading endonuclease RelE of RelBE toxin-antitoxin system
LRTCAISNSRTKAPYRIVFKVSEEHQEIGVIFLGTRQNFYRDLKRYLRSS